MISLSTSNNIYDLFYIKSTFTLFDFIYNGVDSYDSYRKMYNIKTTYRKLGEFLRVFIFANVVLKY